MPRPAGFTLHSLFLSFCLSCLGALFFSATAAQAGLTFELHLLRFNQGQNYRFFTPLNTNSMAPDAPLGTYIIYSPQQPTNGSWRAIQVDTNGANTVAGGETWYPDFNSVMDQITNGNWTVIFTNTTITNVYTFTLTAAGVTSNDLPATIITYPTNNALDVPNRPTLTWIGPGDWVVPPSNTYLADYDFSFFDPGSFSPGQTNWAPSPLPDGVDGSFNLSYVTNDNPSLFIASVPLNTNSSHSAISGWLATDFLESDDSVNFAVTNPPVPTPRLIAHYTFDNTNGLGRDTSGHGYDFDFNGGDGVTATNDAEAGGSAAYFDGGSFFTFSSTPTNLLHTFAGDFSLSFWIKTTQDDGNEGGPGWNGSGIVAADIPGGHYDLVPAALDGGEVGFNTGSLDSDDTVNSTVDVNQDGHYHHVVVTRVEATGEKKIYIDGVLNNSDFATLNPLSDIRSVAIGCAIDGSELLPDNFRQFFQGTLDDVQIYAGALNNSQVASLFHNPGSSISALSGLVAHYTFDNATNIGEDTSGNGYDLTFNGGNGVTQIADAKAGGQAAYFDGASFLSYTPAPGAVLNAFAGNFSLSFWIKTGQENGNEDGPGWAGSGIVAADIPGGANDAVPAALDGGEIGFNTGTVDIDDTLNSTTDINDDLTYHHIVVTRDRLTGEKKIYVDGVLDVSNFAGTNLLNDPALIAVGCAIDASQADPNDASPNQFFQGLLDDIQIYSVVLSSNQVQQLFQNPGSTIAFSAPDDFNAALNTDNLNWSTSGDANWFTETDTAMDGLAARAGSVTSDQSSTLSVTVNGPSTLTFYWSSAADPNADFFYQFDIDGNYGDSLNGNTDWTLSGVYDLGPGLHTLTWTVVPNGDTNPADTGFLDEVTILPDTTPTILFGPFNQTNYPGYPVWLNAGADSNPGATWQWYKIGAGAVSGATNAYFIPTNSGTPAVAGDYYAIASTPVGSAITTTASVSFASAPLPPDWSRAFKSPFTAVDDETITFDYYYGCVVDSTSNIYTAAEFHGAMMVGSQTLISGSGSGDAAAVVKQSPTGVGLWAAAITNNGAGNSMALCVAPAPGGGVYVSGNFNGDNWLGANHLIDAGNGDIFVARFDANGSNVWVKTFGGSGGDFSLLNSLASDAAGNVAVCGLLGSGPVSVGSSNYTVVGREGVLIQLDQNGTPVWSQLLPSELPQYVVNSGGGLYVSLTTAAMDATNVVIGGTSNLTDRAWAVACLDQNNGHAIWVRAVGARSGSTGNNPYYGGLQNDVPRLAVSGTNLFVTGVAYDNAAQFGALTVNFDLPRGLYFVRYDTNGNPQVATTYGSVTTTPESAVANAKGEVYISGDFDTYSFFGNGMLAGPVNLRPFSGGFSQAFLAKFDLNGNPLWAREAVSPGAVNFRGVALAPDGVWASGWGVSSNGFTTFPPIMFGTNSLFTDPLALVGPAGSGVTFLFFPGGVLGKVTESTTSTPLPITLGSPRNTGTNFQFSFPTQSGFTHAVQYRTNLILGTDWRIYTNVSGDGSIQTIPIPYSLFSPSKNGFIRVKTP